MNGPDKVILGKYLHVSSGEHYVAFCVATNIHTGDREVVLFHVSMNDELPTIVELEALFLARVASKEMKLIEAFTEKK